jgi:lactoylglutathione lyase
MRALVLYLFIFYFLTPITRTCNPPTNSPFFPLVLGTDGPADVATNGYNLNHFGLIINNITSTLHFYGKILGICHIFIFHASPSFDIIYMGYSHGGKNGTAYQTGEQLYSQKTNSEGLIEFIYPKDATARLVSSTMKANTFSHVGIVVPNVRQAEERMKEFGVVILKGVGESPSPDDLAAKAFGLGDSVQVAEAALHGI